MKLSFSLSSSKSSSSRSNHSKPPKSFQPALTDTPDNSRFVTVFDPSEALTTNDPSKPVIAPLANTNQWRSKMKNLVPPSDVEDTSRFVVDHLAVDASATDTTTYGLNLRCKPGTEDGGSNGSAPARPEPLMSDDLRFKTDIENLPEDRGIDEFVDVPVEDFSKALLQGYGWKEGQGVGRNNKKDIPIVESKKWAGTSGLGFSSDLPGSEKKERGRVGGEGKPPLPPSRSNGVEKKKVVRIVSGRHAGSKGEVLKSGAGSDKETVVLRMIDGGEKVAVGVDMIAELGSPEEEKCLRKLKEVDVQDGDGRRNDGKKRKRSRDSERSGGRDSRDRVQNTVSWLRSHIRVRVISKSIKGGRHYLKKGVITDVVDPVTCDISMDESRELLQGVDQEILETALPQRGGPVIVLFGRHKGIYGKLMEKDKEKETVVVRDADSHELIKVRMEQIAEYVGDPVDIGY